MLAHCANTSMQTLSPIIDSSIDNVMLQINPAFPVASWIYKDSRTSLGR